MNIILAASGDLVVLRAIAEDGNAWRPSKSLSFGRAPVFMASSPTHSEYSPLLGDTRTKPSGDIDARQVGPLEISTTTRYLILLGVWTATFLSVSCSQCDQPSLPRSLDPSQRTVSRKPEIICMLTLEAPVVTLVPTSECSNCLTIHLLM